MQNIPVVLDGYRMTVVEPPAVKVDQEGKPLLTREGVRQFVVHVFVKAQAGPGGRAPKGEEIKVTLETRARTSRRAPGWRWWVRGSPRTRSRATTGG